MPTAFQHRPMSKILAPAADVTPEPGQSVKPDPAAPAPVEADVKYKDKTTEQVIEMHQNSEKRLGELQNEVGSLRGLVTDLSTVQRTSVAPEPVVDEPVTVSGDEMLADPVSSVLSIVKPQLDKAEADRASDAVANQVRTENAALMRDFGDIETIVGSDDFQSFASRTAGRQADFNVAATGKGVDQVRAARRLLEDYNDFKAATNPNPNPAPTPVEQARIVANEGSGTGAPISTKPQVFESDVIALINSDVAKYRSPSFQAELMEAIKEGRFVKNA